MKAYTCMVYKLDALLTYMYFQYSLHAAPFVTPPDALPTIVLSWKFDVSWLSKLMHMDSQKVDTILCESCSYYSNRDYRLHLALSFVVLVSAQASTPVQSKGKLRKCSHVVLNSPIMQYNIYWKYIPPDLGHLTIGEKMLVPNGVRSTVHTNNLNTYYTKTQSINCASWKLRKRKDSTKFKPLGCCIYGSKVTYIGSDLCWKISPCWLQASKI